MVQVNVCRIVKGKTVDKVGAAYSLVGVGPVAMDENNINLIGKQGMVLLWIHASVERIIIPHTHTN